MRAIFLTLLFLPTLALAKVELFQIVVFNWDTENQALQLMSLGSGTAVGSDLILTNRHVVQTGTDKFADLLLLCQGQAKAGDPVTCDIAAGVAAAHSGEDVALVRPITQEFFPQVHVSYQVKKTGDPVRVYGFPTPTENKLGFGDTRTLAAFEAWVADPTQPLATVGDKLTVTRGKVQSRLRNSDTGFTYTRTDAKVNFGNSGGAAFDEYGDYLGIVTYKDQAGNSIFLEYHQIDDWVREYNNLKPNYEAAAYAFYQRMISGKTKTKASPVTSTAMSIQERLRALHHRRQSLSQSPKTTKTQSPSGQTMTVAQKKLYQHLRRKWSERD